jgi:hypothetical protein
MTTTTTSAPRISCFIDYPGDENPMPTAADLCRMARLLELIGAPAALTFEWRDDESDETGTTTITGELTSVYWTCGHVAVNIDGGDGLSFHCGSIDGDTLVVEGEVV